MAIGLGAHPEPRGQKPARPAVPPPAAMTNGSASPAPVAPALRLHRERRRRPGPRTSTSAPWARTRTRPSRPPCAPWRSDRRAPAASTRWSRSGLPSAGALLRSADAVEGVTARAEGEGRLRRVVLTPDKVVPMPRQRLPVDDLPEDD